MSSLDFIIKGEIWRIVKKNENLIFLEFKQLWYFKL